MPAGVRNVAIVVLLAGAVWALPGGGRAAGLVGAVLSLLFAAGAAFFGGRLYLENRVAIYGLGDRVRALLYGAVALLFVTLVATSRLTASGPGTVAWLVLMAAGVYALVMVFVRARSY